MSAGLIWAEALNQDDDDDDAHLPAFKDPYAWAEWIMTQIDGPRASSVEDVGCGALLAYYTEGMDAHEVQWTSPGELLAAAERFADHIRAGGSEVARILRTYVKDPSSESVDRAVLAELEAVRSMARWAQERGKTKMAFEIN